MSELFDREFLSKLEKLVLNTRLTMTGGASGNRKSRSKGISVEFSDYREYAAGDDFRRVDWNAFARFEKLFIKLFMEEREAHINIFLDTSKSMKWGDPDKSTAARRMAAALCYIGLAGYDRVSLYCVSNKLEKYSLSLRGRQSISRILNLLEEIEFKWSTDLNNAVREVEFGPNKGISIVISDLLYDGTPADLIKYLLYCKQEVHICHILSPQEADPRLDASLRLIDCETGEVREVTASPLLADTYRKVFDRYISELEEICFKWGVNYIKLITNQPVEQMIKRVVAGS